MVVYSLDKQNTKNCKFTVSLWWSLQTLNNTLQVKLEKATIAEYETTS